MTRGAVPFPKRDPEAWQVGLGTIRFVQTVVKAELFALQTEAVFDAEKASGEDGAAVSFKGDELATFTIRLTAWSPDGLDQIIDACKYVREQSRTKGIAVTHPILNAAKISAMVVKQIKWPNAEDGGKPTAEFACIQWRAKKKTAKSVAKKVAEADVPAIYNAHVVKKPAPPKDPAKLPIPL